MTFFHMGGTSGLHSSYSVYAHKQTIHWRWIIAASLLVVSLGIGIIGAQFIGAVQSVSAELPKPQLPTVPVAAVTTEEPETVVVALADDDSTSEELKAKLQRWAEGQDSKWSFYVSSLDGSSALDVRLNEQNDFTLASIYKLYLVRPLALAHTPESWAGKTIEEQSYLRCFDQMIRVSDNPCAESFGTMLGWSRMQQIIETDGYTSTVLNSTERISGTTADTARLLERIYRGEGYDKMTQELTLQAMKAPKAAEGIRPSCLDCTVYNKTGWLKEVANDAAIVEKDGKRYVVVIFSDQGSWSKLHQASAIINTYL